MFKISHSVLDTIELGHAIGMRYGLPAPYCELFYRGMNDIYSVRVDQRKQYAARAWRASWRNLDEINYEMAFLSHLKASGIAAAAAVPARDGSFYFTVEVPEGRRAVALFDWAEGDKLGQRPTPEAAHAIGALFARMHVAGQSFKPPAVRRANPPGRLRENIPFLLKLVQDRPDDIAFYPKVGERLSQELEALESSDLPRGASHGDFHFNNVHVDAAGRPTLLDFDNAGDDFYIQDIMCFVWANGYGNFDPVFAKEFINGYETVRPLTNLERDLMPLFHLAKLFRLISGFSREVNEIGHAPLRFRNLDWFSKSIRKEFSDLGLDT